MRIFHQNPGLFFQNSAFQQLVKPVHPRRCQMMRHTNVRMSQGRILRLQTFPLTGLDDLRSRNGPAAGLRRAAATKNPSGPARASGRGLRLFFGANRRQAAGVRQGWLARESHRLPVVSCHRFVPVMMRMPPVARPVENNRPGEKPQCNQKKSTEINQGLRNAGAGGN